MKLDVYVKGMNCKTALQVGISTYISKSGSKLTYSYRHVTETEDGWIDPSHWLPMCYDLVILKTDSTQKVGWFTGGRWDGRRIDPEDKIIAWKRKPEDEEGNHGYKTRA